MSRVSAGTPSSSVNSRSEPLGAWLTTRSSAPPSVPKSVIPYSSVASRWAAQLTSSSSVAPPSRRRNAVARSSTSNVVGSTAPDLPDSGSEPKPALPSRL